MKKVTLLVASSLLLTSTAFATSFSTHSERTFNTEKYASESQAIDAAKDLMNELNDMNNAQLKHKLSINQNIEYPSLKIDDIEMEIHEFTNFEGDKSYSASIEVAYQYKYHESNS